MGEQLGQLLQCRRIAFVGDSILRNMAAHLMSLVSKNRVNWDFSVHHDVHCHADNAVAVDFFWVPFVRSAPLAVSDHDVAIRVRQC